MTSPIPGLSDIDLLSLSRPAQYLGGERGIIIKDRETIHTRICLAFPDLYEVGISNLGLQILYAITNQMDGVQAERVYAPGKDLERLLIEKAVPLWSLETKTPLSQFDIVGFNLQYELCATSILCMLKLGGVPLKAEDRTGEHPLVIGGGPVAFQPEALADFFDVFLIGDGEELLPEFIERLKTLKDVSRKEKLIALSAI